MCLEEYSVVSGTTTNVKYFKIKENISILANIECDQAIAETNFKRREKKKKTIQTCLFV